jgi:DNA-binding NtrC family response regulator
MDYAFPGNVRELRNIVIRLTTKYAGETVNSEQLVAELDPEQGHAGPSEPLPGIDHRGAVDAAKRQLQAQKNFSLDATLQRLERSYIEAALALTNGNLSQAAKLLGVHRTTLYSRMQSYGGSAIAIRNPVDQ